MLRLLAAARAAYNGRMSQHRNVVILGATGSIGRNALEVVAHLPDRLSALGLSAHNNIELLLEQARRYRPRWVAVTNAAVAGRIASSELPEGCQLLVGPEGIERMVADPDTDTVLTAIVGVAGLDGTLAAIDAGKTLAIANKEPLVSAGPLVTRRAKEKGVRLLPVDSEHSAIFQAMQAGRRDEIERVVLTASGGPFRGYTARQLEDVSVEDALQHPTWRMGKKITIDSATMMNKALEVVEARWLFDLPPERIEVIVHPESVIHSFVEFQDGAVVAQLSPPDMRLPIQYALTYPERLPGPARRLSWSDLSAWHFEQPDVEVFPALALGKAAAEAGGTCGTVLNAANEAAVAKFLAGELRFLDIPRVCREVMRHHDFDPHPDLATIKKLDRWARQEVDRWTTKRPVPS